MALPQGSLTFKDGNLLRGRLQGIDENGIITWSHPDAIDPIKFKSDNISGIKQPKELGDVPPSKSSVTLMSGDVLPCKVLSMDDKELKVETWFGRPFALQREVVSSISL